MTVAKDSVPQSNSDVLKRNPAHNISAALTYTTQLVNILAFYLDVRLPSKLCYRSVCNYILLKNDFLCLC